VSGPLKRVKMNKPVQSMNFHILTVESGEWSHLRAMETSDIFPQLEKEKLTEATDYTKRCVEYNNGQCTVRFP
jgi:hypothetical protein